MQPTPSAARRGARVEPDLRHRADVDGLRAVAVVAVVLFHAELPWLQGGYVGVDVFFVLSGYLITQRIVAAHEGAGFEWSAFWRRRVRRLLPAGLATVAATLLAGVVLLPASRWADLGLSALAAATSWSNVLFSATTGYWDAAALDRPLLHTWSLGVEEQFYVLWPALLAVAMRRRRPLVVLLAVGAVAGAASLVATELVPTAAFYLTPFRIHEFVAGGALVWLDRHAWPEGRHVLALRVALVLAGVGAIVWASVAFGPDTAFPGLAVLVPVLGAVAVVAAREPAPVAGLLAARSVQALGRGSYSLYLVHWPVLVFAAHLTGGLDARVLVVAAVVTGVLTWLQYRYVEQRFRVHSGSTATAARTPGRVPVALVGVTAGAVVLAGAAVAVAGPRVALARFGGDVAGQAGADGGRTPAEAVLRPLEEVNADRGRGVELRCEEAERDGVCGVPSDGPGRTVLVIGDSQAPDGLNAWVAANPDDRVLVASEPGCPPLRDLTGVQHRDDDCDRDNAARLAALERLAPQLDAVLVSMRLREDRAEPLQDLVRWLEDGLGLEAYVLGVGHEFESRADELAQERGAEFLDEPVEPDWLVEGRGSLDARMAALVEDAGGTYVPRLEVFCPDGACALLVPDGSAMVVHDFTHLTLEAAQLLGRRQDVGA